MVVKDKVIKQFNNLSYLFTINVFNYYNANYNKCYNLKFYKS